MKKVSWLVLCGVCAVGWLSIGVGPVQAIAPFKKEFDNKYVKKNSAIPAEKQLADAVAEAKCFVCHAAGTDKKKRNAYGQELAKLLDKKTDAKDVPKIQSALDKVADMPSDPKDPNSKKFGDLIKEGKLPGGDSK